MSTTLSNMSLIQPTIGVDSGLVWEQSMNSNSQNIDAHDHSFGKGVQIQPNGLNISSDLTFNGNNAIGLRSTRFLSQASVLTGTLDVGCVYVVGNELYYNDVTGGHSVQITSNGTVNATSSGIMSGTASASFISGVLVVKGSSITAANVEMLSCVLTNSGNLTNTLTLQAPTLTTPIIETLPSIPGATSFMQMDTSGNMSASIPISQGITASNIANGTITTTQINASAGIVGTQLASQTITATEVANSTITPAQCDSYNSSYYGSGSISSTFSTSSLTPVATGINSGTTSFQTNRPVFFSGTGGYIKVVNALGSVESATLLVGRVQPPSTPRFAWQTDLVIPASSTVYYPMSIVTGFWMPAIGVNNTSAADLYVNVSSVNVTISIIPGTANPTITAVQV